MANVASLVYLRPGERKEEEKGGERGVRREAGRKNIQEGGIYATGGEKIHKFCQGFKYIHTYTHTNTQTRGNNLTYVLFISYFPLLSGLNID